MSFLSEAKAELCQEKIESKATALAECYGILLYCTVFSPVEIRIITASAEFASRLQRLFRKALGLEFDVAPEAAPTGKKRSLYIHTPEKLRQIFAAFGADTDSTVSQHVNFAVLEEQGTAVAFLRGAFLAGGSVTDPEKSFHLELATSHPCVSREVYTLLRDLEDMSANPVPKESQRAGNTLLYFKKPDAIADFLAVIGATSASMAVINAHIEREMRNEVNRKINCDSANADKIVAAAQPQLAAIRRIRNGPGLDWLPEPLQDTALLRLTNPAASLSDLAMLSLPKVSRGALAHRLKQIIILAEGLDAEEVSAPQPED